MRPLVTFAHFVMSPPNNSCLGILKSNSRYVAETAESVVSEHGIDSSSVRVM